jgi:REP element-mobilizing transposase RayT
MIHAVVRTYKSQLTLPSDDKVKFLYQDMWGIIKNKEGFLYRINSMPDNMHLLFTMPATISLSDFMNSLKASSSRAVKTQPGFERFVAWGKGYAALSKSMGDKQTVINYIINQQEHHKTVTFKDEYIAFIRDMGLDFDERDWDR